MFWQRVGVQGIWDAMFEMVLDAQRIPADLRAFIGFALLAGGTKDQPVQDMLGDRAPVTLELVTLAFAVSLLIAIPVAIGLGRLLVPRRVWTRVAAAIGLLAYAAVTLVLVASMLGFLAAELLADFDRFLESVRLVLGGRDGEALRQVQQAEHLLGAAAAEVGHLGFGPATAAALTRN